MFFSWKHPPLAPRWGASCQVDNGLVSPSQRGTDRTYDTLQKMPWSHFGLGFAAAGLATALSPTVVSCSPAATSTMEAPVSSVLVLYVKILLPDDSSKVY
jgi:hypothetical protein